MSKAKHALANFATIAITAALGIGVNAVAARFLAPEGMGVYSLAVWLVGVAGLFANMGYVSTALKFVAEACGKEDAELLRGIIAGTTRGVTGASILTALGLAAGSGAIAGLYQRPELAGALMVGALAAIPIALLAQFTAIFQGLQRYAQIAVITGMMAPLTLAGLFASWAFGWGGSGLIATTGVAAAAGVLAYLALLSRAVPGWWRGRTPEMLAPRLRGYRWPVFAMLCLDTIVWQRSEVFFLGAYAPAAHVAYYGLAFTLASMAMRLIPGTLVGLLIPSMARSEGAGDREQVGRIFAASCRYMAMLAIPVAVGGIVLARPMVQVLYGPGYEPVAGILSALLLTNALVMIYGFPASSVLYATDAQRRLVAIGGTVAVVNLALAWFLIPRFGLAGAIASNAVAQLASLVPGLWAAIRQLGVRVPWRMLPPISVASALMAIATAPMAGLLSPMVAMLTVPPVGAAVYLATLWGLGVFDAGERQAILNLTAKVSRASRAMLPRLR